MRRIEVKGRLLQDREQLLKTLRDHDAGKLEHLGKRDRDHFVASVERRIAELNKLQCLSVADSLGTYGDAQGVRLQSYVG